MTPYLIIDGYNLMHAAGIARRTYGPGDMERCRSRMNRELAAVLAVNVLNQATIVYDAFDSISNDHRLQQEFGLTVLFAPQGTDADGEIERLLLQHSVPKRVLVVSSDHRLHKAASRRRARCIDSDEFWESFDHQATGTKADEVPVVEAPATPPPVKPDIVDDLQQWANDLEKQADVQQDVELSGGTFDEIYLRKLSDDLNDGRLE